MGAVWGVIVGRSFCLPFRSFGVGGGITTQDGLLIMNLCYWKRKNMLERKFNVYFDDLNLHIYAVRL